MLLRQREKREEQRREREREMTQVRAQVVVKAPKRCQSYGFSYLIPETEL